MSITSETQRKYDPNKGGFSYYTLFHADKGERPSWAQDGDMLEEFGEGGKAYVCSRDAKGRIKWTEKADWDRQTGGGSSGGGLPADFPAEGIANANKFLGFDENGDYAALDAPSGAEKFVVTLTQENDTWTADKTVAEIVAADADGEIVECVCSYQGLSSRLQLSAIQEIEEDYAPIFAGTIHDGEGLYVLNAIGFDDDWGFLSTPIPTSSNAPLIVTLTESGGAITGDKTYQEVKEARLAGRPVDLVLPNVSCASVIDVSYNGSTISVAFIANGQLATATGAPSDYVGITFG